MYVSEDQSGMITNMTNYIIIDNDLVYAVKCNS